MRRPPPPPRDINPLTAYEPHDPVPHNYEPADYTTPMSKQEYMALRQAVLADQTTYKWGTDRRMCGGRRLVHYVDTVSTADALLREKIGEVATALMPSPNQLFLMGDRVRKIKGSSWQGHVVGTYSTRLTPIGYCVESEREPGSVQLYPQAALERVPSDE